MIFKQLNWIRSGKMGCSFATALAKNPDKIGWNFYKHTDLSGLNFDSNTYIASIVFPAHYTANTVLEWALSNGMYLESVDELHKGLRIRCKDGISWVQYFGQDSHVGTRKSPYPMLSMCLKLPERYYSKVGFSGVLHLAHACVSGIAKKAQDKLWNSSFQHTKRVLGFSPTISEAAKTTFKL